MRISKVWAIAKREMSEIRKNKQLLYTLLLMPIFISVIVPVSMLYGVVSEGANETSLPFIPQDTSMPPQQALAFYILQPLVMLFMVIPAVLPSFISSYSIVGEKIYRSLEPLLATPVSDSEILAGKILSALLPTIAATWMSFLIFTIAVDYMLMPIFLYPVLPNAEWLFSAFVIAPLIGWLSIDFSVMVSSKVSDIRTAQQISGIIVIPTVIFLIAALAGVLMVDMVTLSFFALVMLVLDLAAFEISHRIFERESILIRWK